MPHQAFFDLTAAHCRQFNEATPDAPNVRYYSVAGEHDGSLARPEWLLPYSIVRAAEGPNDGVVSLASAKYGESFEVWPGDHFSIINRQLPNAKPCDVLDRWEGLVERLEPKQIPG
jgi:triacylglycerol lipase